MSIFSMKPVKIARDNQTTIHKMCKSCRHRSRNQRYINTHAKVVIVDGLSICVCNNETTILNGG